MLQLQALNACVAFTSLVFAAVVTERLRAREALERAAAELEERVRRRTHELSAANTKLGEEIAERRHAEARLRDRERLLAEAEAVARLGSWEWELAEDRVTWSDEMYRIHGYRPQEFAVTFEKAVELVVPEDLAKIHTNVERSLRQRADAPGLEYRIVRPDGQERLLHGRAKLIRGPGGEPVRMVGTVQDITERAIHEREHLIAETLQSALVPRELPQLHWLAVGARYVSGGSGAEVGGDWYDVIPLHDESVAVVIGDVAGRGLAAATVMAHLRMAIRAYAVEGHDPAEVVTRAHTLLQHVAPEQMVTLLYLVIDPMAMEMRFVNAGHPPPLLIREDGAATYLESKALLPIGLDGHRQYLEQIAVLEPRMTVLLYTDGLVEGRTLPVTEGLERLLRAAKSGPEGVLQSFCDRLIDVLLPHGSPEDDVAVLALQLVPVPIDGLRLRIPAHPNQLAPVRRRLGRWLNRIGASNEEISDIILAAGEACSNSIEHAYGPSDGFIELEGTVADGVAELVVRDFGRWRRSRSRDRGRGLRIMEACMEEVVVTRGEDGTEIRLRRGLGSRSSS